MENLIIGLDFVLVAAGLWMVYVISRAKLGGIMRNTLNFVTIGALLLGLAHLLETVTFEVLHLSLEATELSHRIIVLAGFVMLTLGFRQIAQLRKNA